MIPSTVKFALRFRAHPGIQPRALRAVPTTSALSLMFHGDLVQIHSGLWLINFGEFAGNRNERSKGAVVFVVGPRGKE
jgi:hypothetical protein